MKPVRLVFRARDSASARLFGHAPVSRLAAGAVLLLALGALGAIALMTWQARQETRAALSATGALHARAVQSNKAGGREKPVLTVQQTRDWNLVTRQLNTPWATIFDALETSTPEDVALVAIEPDAGRASVRLQVEAKTLDTLLAYAQALKANGPFQDVTLLKHETNDQDATRPMRLSLDVRLKANGGAR
jgi:hypothetical protein